MGILLRGNLGKVQTIGKGILLRGNLIAGLGILLRGNLIVIFNCAGMGIF